MALLSSFAIGCPLMQNPPPIPDLLAELAHFATAVQQSLGAEPIDWQRRSAPGQWSLTEVICHLRDVEQEVHQARFRALLAKDDAFLAGATPDEWAEERSYQQQNGRQALIDFVRARQETADLLQRLEEPIWQRSGNHAFFGRTTMHELLYLVVQHDRVHWRQIREADGK
jgi:hypothetical protein